MIASKAILAFLACTQSFATAQNLRGDRLLQANGATATVGVRPAGSPPTNTVTTANTPAQQWQVQTGNSKDDSKDRQNGNSGDESGTITVPTQACPPGQAAVFKPLDNEWACYPLSRNGP